MTRLLNDLTIREESFVRTAPVYNPRAPKTNPSNPVANPQTVNFCEKLGIDDPIQVIMARSGRTMTQPNPDLNKSSCNDFKSPETDKSIPVVQTPVKCSKMSLPAPITPSKNESEDTNWNSSMSTEVSFLSDSTTNTTNDSATPMSAGPKKTFKRRNLSIYNNTPDFDETDTSNSMLESVSPRSSKLPCRDML